MKDQGTKRKTRSIRAVKRSDKKSIRRFHGFFIFAILVISNIASSSSGQSTGPGRVDVTVKNIENLTPHVFAGEWIKLRVTVENRGTDDAGEFRVDLFKTAQNSSNLPVKGDISHTVYRLAKGSQIQIDYVFQAKSRSYNVYVKADAREDIKESSESNNVYGPLAIGVEQGSRPDDQYEENDQPQNAPLLAEGSYNLVSEDADYFSVQAKAGDYIDVSIVYDAPASNLDLVLLDSTGAKVAESKGYFDKERILYQAPNAGTYIVYVIAGDSRAQYMLDVKSGKLPELGVSIQNVNLTNVYIPTEEDLADIYAMYEEDGFNLSDANKAEIKRRMTKYTYDVSVRIQNSGTAVDEPFYVDLFRSSRLAPSPGTYGEDWISISPQDFADPDDNTKTLSSIQKTLTVTAIPGIYSLYAAVDNDAYIQETDESNNVSAPHSIQAGDEVVADDNYEPNNIFPGMGVSQGNYSGLVALDDDYFSVTLPAGKVLNVSIDFVHALGDLDLYLIGPNRESLARSTGTANREFISYINNTGADQALTIRVDEVSQNLRYSLGVNITSAYEVDLTINAINHSPISLAQGDSVTATVQVENKGANDAFNVRVDLFNLLENTPVSEGMTSDTFNILIPVIKGRQKTSVSFTFPVGQGAHYLSAIIDTQNAFTETKEDNNVFGTVTLNVGAGISDDALEASAGFENDTPQNAFVIGATKYNQLAALDEDWYKYVIPPGKTMQSAVYFEHINGDIDVLLYSYNAESGGYTLLKSSETTTDHEVVAYKNTGTEPLEIYLRILPIDKANVYSMDIRNLDAGGYPDLIIASMVTHPVNPAAGEIIRTTLAVENSGTAPTSDISYLDFYYSLKQPVAGQYGDMFQIIPSGLQPGERVYISFEYALENGDYHLYAFVDTDNSVAESVESNNVFGPKALSVAPPAKQNIKVANIQASYSGGKINIVFNLSGTNVDAGSVFDLKFDLVDSTDLADAKSVYEWNEVSYKYTLTSSAQASLTYSLTTDAYLPSGTYYVKVHADSANVLGEADETDNIGLGGPIVVDNPGSVYRVETSNTGQVQADTIMEVYRYDGPALNRDAASVSPMQLTLVRRSDNMSAQNSGVYMNFDTGTYFIRVYGKGESSGAYRIAMHQNGAVLASEGPQYESQNTPSSAYYLNPGQARNEYISSSADEDWYFFTVYNIDTYQVAANSGAPVKVELYQFNGTSWTGINGVAADQLTLVASDNASSFGSLQTALGPGKYFIRVYTDPGLSQSYGIVFAQARAERPYVYGDEGVADIFENDSTVNISQPFGVDTPQYHTLYLTVEDPNQPPVDGLPVMVFTDDEDWYFFEIH